MTTRRRPMRHRRIDPRRARRLAQGYTAECERCGLPILPGQEIRPTSSRSLWVHGSCDTREED